MDSDPNLQRTFTEMCQIGARIHVLKNNGSTVGLKNPYRQSFFFGITFGIKKINVLTFLGKIGSGGWDRTND